jgi:hypothetical protein
MRKLVFLTVLLIAFPAFAGTLIIEQWAEIGTPENSNAQIYRGQVALTADATTSTSDEYITSNSAGRYMSAFSVSGNHRVAIGYSSADTIYFYVKEGERRDVSLPAAPAARITYRTNE